MILPPNEALSKIQSPDGPPRGPWEVQCGVLFALLLREMKARVGGQWVGAIWTLIEPLTHVLILVTMIAVIRGRGGSMPYIDYPVFLVTGLLPYFLFQHLSMRLMLGIDANRGLFSYRQVKPLDTLLARAGVEAMMNGVVYIFTLSILGWLGLSVVPASPLEVLGVNLVMGLLGTGFGVLCAVGTHGRDRLRAFVRMLLMPLYFASGVIFPVDIMPPEVLQWLLLNPLLHLVELSRHAFIPAYVPAMGVNAIYPIIFTLAMCTMALLLYRADRLRLVTSA